MVTSESRGRRAARALALFVLTVVVCLLLLFVVLLTRQAVTSPDEREGSLIAVAVGLVVLIPVLFGWRALVRRVVRSRGGNAGSDRAPGVGSPAAASVSSSWDRPGRLPTFTDPGSARTVPTSYVPTAVGTRRTRHRTAYACGRALFTAVSMTTVFGVLAVVAAIAAVGQLHEHAATQRAQAASPVTAQVIDDRVTRHRHSKSRDTFSTAMTVRLLTGPGGLTVVHVDAAVRDLDGQEVRVVVDPQDPGYAELPGRPYTTTGDVVGGFLGAGVLMAIAPACAAILVQQLRLRRLAHATTPPVPYGTARR